MAMVPKLIKAAINSQKALPEQVQSQGLALLKGLTGNSNFTTLPVDLNAFNVEGSRQMLDTRYFICTSPDTYGKGPQQNTTGPALAR